MNRYALKLTYGIEVKIQTTLAMSQLLNSIMKDQWFTDIHGWLINPKSIVMIKSEEEEND